ncbi:MAG TPA: S8 family serine peptidase [Chloroflexota bacterium]|nr:S8 family serine peptidase [Chloroflexota bacterium]
MSPEARATTACPLCGAPTDRQVLEAARWLAPEVLARLARRLPGWRREAGACPSCVQEATLFTLLEVGQAALRTGIEEIWLRTASTAFAALPTPLRLRADPRYTGWGVTIALIDSGFYPHPDLTQPHNRIRAWVDAAEEPVRALRFGHGERPRWPGWDRRAPEQWHGLMTSSVAAGNGWLSQGLYRGLACEADLVLIQARDERGHISNGSIARALRWLEREAAGLGVRVVNLSVAGDPTRKLHGNPVDAAVEALTRQGITVVAAVGNDGERRLVPPATAPAALTVGGLNDRNTFDQDQVELWHSNYGETVYGTLKPELVAPSIWLAAPLLPGTAEATEAAALFARRSEGDPEVEEGIHKAKLVTPHYKHVDGTSFSAPLVAATVACMLQANPRLTPALIRQIVIATARRIPSASVERQGAGALDPRAAVKLALLERHGRLAQTPVTPQVVGDGVIFILHEHDVEKVELFGSWDGWRAPGKAAEEVEPGLWRAVIHDLAPGHYQYKFLIDGARWHDDPANPRKARDQHGGLNSLVIVPEPDAGKRRPEGRG